MPTRVSSPASLNSDYSYIALIVLICIYRLKSWRIIIWCGHQMVSLTGRLTTILLTFLNLKKPILYTN